MFSSKESQGMPLKKKAANFSANELEVLLSHLEKHKDTIYGSFNGTKG